MAKATSRRKSLSRTYSFKGLVSVTITVRNMAAVGRHGSNTESLSTSMGEKEQSGSGVGG